MPRGEIQRCKQMKAKSRRILLPLTVIPAVGLVALLKCLPVYPDEEQWIYVNARQFTDNTMQYLFPVCREGFQIAQPLIWYPIRCLEWILYSHLGLVNQIRAVGLAQAIITLLLLMKFLNIYARDLRQAQLVLLSGMMMGLLPFLLVLNRPEQLLLILFLSFLNLSSTYKSSLQVWKKLALAALVALLILSMPAIHPKGSLFAAMGTAIFIFVVKGNTRFAKVAVFTSACFSIAVSTQVWSLRTLCPESEFLTRTFGDITVNPTQLDASIFRKIIGNIIRTPKYLLNMMYQNTYQSDWMAQRNMVPTFLLVLANIALFLFATLLIYSVYKFVLRGSFRKSDIDDSKFISLVFISGFGVLSILQRTKNFYDSYLPAILILLAVAITINFTRKWRNLKFMLVLSVTISIPALLFTANGFPKVGAPSTEILAKRIIKECEITKSQIEKGNFVIDGSLSTPFWESPRFIYAGYLWGWWAQDVKAEELIRELNSPVVIVRNEKLLSEMEGDVITEGYLCRNIEKSKP